MRPSASPCLFCSDFLLSVVLAPPFINVNHQVLKLNRLAHIDYRWIKNKAWCKFQIEVDNGIISAHHDLLMNGLILPYALLVRGKVGGKRGKTFLLSVTFFVFHLLITKSAVAKTFADVIIQEEKLWKLKLSEPPRDSQALLNMQMVVLKSGVLKWLIVKPVVESSGCPWQWMKR